VKWEETDLSEKRNEGKQEEKEMSRLWGRMKEPENLTVGNET
jgi:hypothetical protein